MRKQIAAKEAEFHIGDIENPEAWHIVQELRLIGNKAVDEYVEVQENFKKAYQRVGGEGTILPGSPGAARQKALRTAKNAVSAAWGVAEPILLTAATRGAVNVVVSQVGPYLANKAGEAAASAASKANAGWTWLDPTGYADAGVRNTAAAVAKGEVYRDLGTAVNYTEKYGVPAVKTACRATVLAAKGLYNGANLAVNGAKKASTAASSAYTWGKSWFASKPSEQPSA